MALNFEAIDVEDFLKDLGMNNVQDIGNDVRFSCPFPEGHNNADANPSSSMEKGTTRTYCFGCGNSWNAVSFLAQLENVSPIQAAIWIKERFGAGFVLPGQGSIADAVRNQLQKEQKIKDDPPPVINEEEAIRRKIDWKSIKAWMEYGGGEEDDYDAPRFYMLKRGFTPEILNEFDIGWDKISERICVPIRNEHGHLVGFKGRAYKKEPRYLVLGGSEYGFEPYEVSKIVFALHNIDHREKTIIVTEGELNAIAMRQHGFNNTVGISGKTISEEQIKLIKSVAEKVVLIFDEKDDAIRAARKLQRSIPTSIVKKHSKDPAEMTKDEIMSLLASRKSSLLQ